MKSRVKKQIQQKLEKKFIFSFIIIFMLFGISNSFYSQKITINITSENDFNVEDVNLQLLKDNKLIDFRKTNKGGSCFFNISVPGKYSLKISSFFFKTKFVSINTEEANRFDITLEAQLTEIEKVEIKARPNIVFERKDTISYNLKAIVDGSERNAEDIIKKLPGLEINEFGKVTYQGDIVGNILIDGNEFFGKNHTLATKNISADMLAGVDLWRNYTTINGNSSTALNLKLKEEYRSRITGNAEGNYGSNDAYLFHANLFNFNNKGNFSFISDFNNIAKDPISYSDFSEMNYNEAVDFKNASTFNEMPSFLNNDGLAKNKNNSFGALQYSKSSKSFQITSFAIVNLTKLQKFNSTNKMFFNGDFQNFNVSEKKSENNHGFLGALQLKLKQKLSNGFLYYDFKMNPSSDTFENDIDRQYYNSNILYAIDNKIRKENISNLISLNKRVFNSDLILSFNQILQSENRKLDIMSNDDLFFTNDKFIKQDYNLKSKKYSFNADFKNKNNFLNFEYQSEFSSEWSNSSLNEKNSNSFQNNDLQYLVYSNNFVVNKKIFNVDLTYNVGSNFVNFNKSDNHFLSHNFKIIYNPIARISTSYKLEYNSKYSYVHPDQLFTIPFYSKNLSFYQNLSIEDDSLFRTENYKFTWSRFNLQKGNYFLFLLIYNRDHPNITTNMVNVNSFYRTEGIFGANKERLFLHVSDERKVFKFATLKSKFSNSSSMNNNQIEGFNNRSSFKSYEISQVLSSNFKNFLFQFDLGYSFKENIFEQSFYDSYSTQQNKKFYFAISGNIKKNFIYNLKGDYLVQNSQTNVLRNFLLGGSLSFKPINSKIEYNILYDNLLNMKSFKYINSYNSELAFEESVISALPGYIVGGLKYYF
ncbi:hypothetical protein QGN23_04065 [Chryseobacterium gotjawalense]|uniref:Outer membrane protein beta-barrel domain-containing protein n=1 Tax=Chryseobacterium gotjawalense TaxID=3042315 RepID=A0ABY8RF84_9FLAO|nr:hypothetical protein [Chryseobacterium sp. wdc7]WHF52461.1 hypothetical protein QGN23_04065 [Chryseobacterium sp. wdc7]